jgi:hypothetical protein
MDGKAPLHARSTVIRISSGIPSVLPQKHFRETTQGDRTHQNSYTDRVPPMSPKRQHCKPVKQCDQRHDEKKGTGEIAMYASAPDHVGYTSPRHDS